MTLDADLLEQMKTWRRMIHRHPELAFDEYRTAGLVAEKLAEFGLDVERNIAGTGVVGTLRNGAGPSIGLRADMDALPISEENTFDYRSAHPGCMHACGHDGHTAMLLGAAAHLARHRDFCGTLHFIFQPAEEMAGGAGEMIRAGLFDRFPCDAVYALHNWPGLKLGHFAINPGPMMASLDTFEIIVSGTGAHAAQPHKGVDSLLCAATIVTSLQSIVSRSIDPHEALVVTVTQLHGGDAWNVIPASTVIRGTVRAMREVDRQLAKRRIREIAGNTAAAFGATADVRHIDGYPPTVNTSRETDLAIAAARRVVGDEAVKFDCVPSMASEDFSLMLQRRPGAYMWLGVDGDAHVAPLHNPHYDFNDQALGYGAGFFVEMPRGTHY